jgi:hypothetical protein
VSAARPALVTGAAVLTAGPQYGVSCPTGSALNGTTVLKVTTRDKRPQAVPGSCPSGLQRTDVVPVPTD